MGYVVVVLWGGGLIPILVFFYFNRPPSSEGDFLGLAGAWTLLTALFVLMTGIPFAFRLKKLRGILEHRAIVEAKINSIKPTNRTDFIIRYAYRYGGHSYRASFRGFDKKRVAKLRAQKTVRVVINANEPEDQILLEW